MIEKYIVEFLKDNNRLIIPDLGAFIVKINKDDNSKNITFNDVIKFNDNTFANFVCSKENIILEEAAEHISEFVKKATEALSQGKEIKIEDIGSLAKDAKGYVTLVTEIEEVEEKQIIEEKKEDIMELIDEEPTSSNEENIIPDVPVNEDEIIELIDNKEELAEPEKTVEGPPVAPIPEVKEEIIKKEEPKAEVKESPKKEKIKESKPKQKKEKPVKEKSKDKKSNKLIIVLIIVAGVIIILGALGFVFKNQVKEYYAKFFHKESKVIVTEETNIIPENSLVVDTTGVFETEDTLNVEEPIEEVIEAAPVKETKPTHANTQTGLHYHVIGGSFQSKNEADKFVRKLQSKGYNSKIVNTNRNGMHRVCYNSFKTKDEARTELNNIKASGNEAWILNY